MDILTLELLDVTVFQALLELRSLLDEHPGEALRVQGEEELIRVNVVGFLEKQGRTVHTLRQGSPWELQVAQASRTTPQAKVIPAPHLPPVLLLRSAFAPGDRALGRRLLLETLATLPPGTPWLCLAHQGVELLDDPVALGMLEGLKARGIPVHVSAASAAHLGSPVQGFDPVPDEPWQRLLGQGGVTVL